MGGADPRPDRRPAPAVPTGHRPGRDPGLGRVLGLTRTRALGSIVWAMLACAPALAEQAQAPGAEPPHPAPPAADLGPESLHPEPDLPWLEEVRAQRRAAEERRESAREAFEARRRQSDPWGAAQLEAREQEQKRRREARLKRIEEERGRFRALGPTEPPRWGLGSHQAPPLPAYPPFPGPPLGAAPESGPVDEPGVLAPLAPPSGSYSPQDWDNLWYYRGY